MHRNKKIVKTQQNGFLCGVKESLGNEDKREQGKGGKPIEGRASSRWVTESELCVKKANLGWRRKRSERLVPKVGGQDRGHTDITDQGCWGWEQGNQPQRWRGGKVLAFLHVEDCHSLEWGRDRRGCCGQKWPKISLDLPAWVTRRMSPSWE